MTPTCASRTCCAVKSTSTTHRGRSICIARSVGRLPQFGHLPLILAPDGSKLSKRHGAVSVLQYDDDGFLPEALFNYLARLGWSHGDDEKFTREQLVEWFDLQHVNRAPAQYNLDKLMWLNGEYIKEADNDRLARLGCCTNRSTRWTSWPAVRRCTASSRCLRIARAR